MEQNKMTLTELNRLLNERLTEKSRPQIGNTTVSDWLQEKGYLVFKETEGSRKRVPTDQGRKIGIVTETVTKEDGTSYLGVFYSQKALALLLENGSELYAMEQKKALEKAAKTARSGAAWTAEERHLLETLFKEGVCARDMALKLKRTTGSIQLQLVKMGLVEKENWMEKLYR